jgi:hypothetical protein
LRLETDSIASAAKIFAEAANSRFEFDALDVAPDEPGVFARLAGPAAALEVLSREVFARWPGETVSDTPWGRLREFRWADPDAPLVKVVLSPATMGKLDGVRTHFSAGGNVAFVSLSSAAPVGDFDKHLQKSGLSGVTLRGRAPLWLGARSRPEIFSAVKSALDPENRFPSLDD